MTVANSPIFGMLNEKMNWLSQRQRVLAQNVANADTPTYRAKDLRPLDFRQELARGVPRISMAYSNSRHIVSSDQNYQFRVERAKRAYETAPMKNNVVLEEQMMKLTTTQSDYQMATSVYRKFTQLYKQSLGSGGGA